MTSAHDQPHLPNSYGATAAPPPTPSAQPNLLSTSDAAEALSRLFHRLPPPSLSLPYCRLSLRATTSPPLVSLSDPNPTLLANILSASQLGFFQLTDHSISPEVARSAESESLSLFNLPHDQKLIHFPKSWPLGFEGDDEEDDHGIGESFCLNSACSTESSELSLTSLRKFTCEMEKLGLQIVEELSRAVGFENPVRKDPCRVSSLMWISGCSASACNNSVVPGRFYPYVVGLQYQIRCQKSSLLADSGWVHVVPQVDSVLVTLGDIAQVWSNGKVKKVRGKAVPSCPDGKNSKCITMSLLVTLPMDSSVSPVGKNEEEEEEEEEDFCGSSKSSSRSEEKMAFNSFSFEDYAWRVYHERRLLLKDPLDRYRSSMCNVRL